MNNISSNDLLLSNEIHNQLSSELNELYNVYKDKISFEEFEKIVLLTIEENKKMYTSKKQFLKIITRMISEQINEEFVNGYDSLYYYYKEVKAYPVLSDKEEKELFMKYKNGDLEAKEKLVNCNLRLVIHIAKRYKDLNYSFEDLIQEGNFGLIKAIELFDPSLNNKFSTYAYWWIRQAMLRARADKSRIIRLPVHLNEQISKYNKIKGHLLNVLKREPTLDEIAKYTGLSIQKITELEILSINRVTSLNQYIGESEDCEIEELIPDPNFDTEEKVLNKNLSQELEKVLESCQLTPRELDIINKRFGLAGNEVFSLEELGKNYGITRERIRQIEASALRKIRKSSLGKSLKVYLNNEEESDKKNEYQSTNRAKILNYMEQKVKLKNKK